MSTSVIDTRAYTMLSNALHNATVTQAPESYKDVNDVVNTCHEAGLSKKCLKLRPIAVIKG